MADKVDNKDQIFYIYTSIVQQVRATVNVPDILEIVDPLN